MKQDWNIFLNKKRKNKKPESKQTATDQPPNEQHKTTRLFTTFHCTSLRGRSCEMFFHCYKADFALVFRV